MYLNRFFFCLFAVAVSMNTGFGGSENAKTSEVKATIGSVSSPFTLSPDGSTLISGIGGNLVTSDGTWTFQNRGGGQGLILLNGQSTSALASELFVLNGGNLYALSNAGAWYQWLNFGWIGTLNPFSNANPVAGLSPDGSTLMPGSGEGLVTSVGIWTFQNRGGGQGLILLNGQSTSAFASKLFVLNGGNLYALTKAGAWYQWINSAWIGSFSPLPNSDLNAGVSLDGSVLVPGSGGSLVTAAGTWTFENRAGAGGQGRVLLNGQSTSGLAAKLFVLNGGNIYALTNLGALYQWINSRWAINPVPIPLLAGAGRANIPIFRGEKFGGWNAASSLDEVNLVSTAVVISDGVTKVAIVSVEALLMYDSQIQDIKAQVLALTGISNVFVTATHDHAALNTDSACDPNVTCNSNGVPAVTRINNAIVTSIVQANANLVPAKIGAGFGNYGGSFNRVVRDPQNVSTETPTLTHCGEDRSSYISQHPDDPVDTYVGVIRLLDMNNNSIATLVNYASHNVVFGSTLNTAPTGDLFARARIDIESSLGGAALVLQGAAGDLDPWCSLVFDSPANMTLSQANQELSNQGQALASVVTSVASGISQFSNRETLRIINTVLPVNFICSVAGTKVELNTLSIGNNIMFATVPGELFNSLGTSVRERTAIPSFLAVTFLLGYTNDAIGYIPEEKYCDDNPVWPDPTSPMKGFRTHYQPNAMCVPCGTGERIVDALVSMLNNGNVSSP